RNVWADLEDKIAQISSDDIKLDGKIDVNARQIAFNEERLENNASHKKRILEDQANLSQRIQEEVQKIEEAKGFLSTLDERLQKCREVLQEKKAGFHALVNLMEEAKRSIEGEENKILSISSSQVQIKNRLTDIMKEVQGGLARKRRLEMESVKVQDEKNQVEARFQEICQKIAVLIQDVFQSRQALDRQQSILNQLNENFISLEKQIDDLEKQRLFLISQKEFIEKLRVQYHDIPDPIVEGHLLTTTSPLEHHTGIIGKVKSVTSVSHDKLIAFKEAAVDPSVPVYQVVCEAKFIELDPQQISLKIERLTEQIEELGKAKQVLEAKIEEQKQAESSVELQIQEQEKNLSVYEAQKEDVSADIRKLNEELDLVSVETKEVNALLENLRNKEVELTSQFDHSLQELQQSQLLIKERQDLVSSKIHEREQINIAVAQLETEMSSIEDKRRGDQRNFEMFSRDLENDQMAVGRLTQEYQDLEIKEKQYGEEIDALRVQTEQLKADKESLQDILRQYTTQKEEVSSKLESLQSQVAVSSEAIQELKNTEHHQQLEEQQALFKKKEIKDRLFQSYKIEWESLDQYLQALTVPSSSTEPQESMPVLEVGEAPTPAAPISNVLSFDTGLFNPNLSIEELQLSIDRLKKRCDAYGAVNLVAIEEFEELRQRFEFLTKQQSDLITAKDSLHKTIQKINRETREMFMETFSRVSEEFRAHFRLLFGGGEAQLILLDPENVLESGIEIIARPPGKKLQNISLLSGGEKSLTAIALIFGVFKVNPSPFCVLDEIDAALDESNVGRFAYVLKEFAKIAQFIVITHNKKTIANANVMYGITMEETGVSKIVSVKFQDKQETIEQNQTAVPA
ncbi:MAG: hypothetical protein NUV91_07220, partial [Candidatus Omnitrophica bacterium]|nr:hypothetical protein [Candidatus Omnitrophota bacterium]